MATIDKWTVSLSANFEFLESEPKRPAQETLKSLFWSSRPGLQAICEKKSKGGSNYQFHVCFITTKEIDSEEHYRALKKAFSEIIHRHITTLRFRPREIKSYTIAVQGGFIIGRSPEDSPLVLIPDNPEDFQRVNLELATKFNELSTLWGKKYELDDDLVPSNYTPHATIINRSVLTSLEQTAGKIKETLTQELNARLPTQPLTLKKHQYKY